MSILNLILAIFLPPEAAYLQVDLTTHFWINMALTLGGYISGVIHAVWLVVTQQKVADILNEWLAYMVPSHSVKLDSNCNPAE